MPHLVKVRFWGRTDSWESKCPLHVLLVICKHEFQPRKGNTLFPHILKNIYWCAAFYTVKNHSTGHWANSPGAMLLGTVVLFCKASSNRATCRFKVRLRQLKSLAAYPSPPAVSHPILSPALLILLQLSATATPPACSYFLNPLPRTPDHRPITSFI